MATRLKDAFVKFEIQHIAWENNEQIDLLSKLASTKKKGTTIQETISKPSLYIMANVTPVDRVDDWDFGLLGEKLAPRKSNGNNKAQKKC